MNLTDHITWWGLSNFNANLSVLKFIFEQTAFLNIVL